MGAISGNSWKPVKLVFHKFTDPSIIRSVLDYDCEAFDLAE